MPRWLLVSLSGVLLLGILQWRARPSPPEALDRLLVHRFEEIATASRAVRLKPERGLWPVADLGGFLADTHEGDVEFVAPNGRILRHIDLPPIAHPGCTVLRWSYSPSRRWLHLVRHSAWRSGCPTDDDVRRRDQWSGFVDLESGALHALDVAPEVVGWRGELAIGWLAELRLLVELDPANPGWVHKRRGYVSRVLAVSADGESVVAGGLGRNRGTYLHRRGRSSFTLHRPTSAERGPRCRTGGVFAADFSPDGQWLLTRFITCPDDTGDRRTTLRVVRVDTGERFARFEFAPGSPDLPFGFAPGRPARFAFAETTSAGAWRWRVVDLDGDRVDERSFEPLAGAIWGTRPPMPHPALERLRPSTGGWMPRGTPPARGTAWSPDGRHLAFVGFRQLHWLDVDDGGRGDLELAEPVQGAAGWGSVERSGQVAVSWDRWAGFPASWRLDGSRPSPPDPEAQRVQVGQSAAWQGLGATPLLQQACDGGSGVACYEVVDHPNQNKRMWLKRDQRLKEACLLGSRSACGEVAAAANGHHAAPQGVDHAPPARNPRRTAPPGPLPQLRLPR